MTIADIKGEMGLPTLTMQICKDEQGVPTGWVRHWDNAQRIAVAMEQTLMDKIVKNPGLNTLISNVTKKTAESTGKDYVNCVVFEAKDIVGVL